MESNRYRLESMQHAECHVTIQRRDLNDFEARLISYQTVVLVAHHTNDGVELLCSGTYCVTTARHINRFTTEFFGKNLYHGCKRAFDNTDAFPVAEKYPFALVANYPFTSAEAEQFRATVRRYESGDHAPRYRGYY